MAIQREYRRYQQAGWPGALARPAEPHAYHTGRLYVAPGSDPVEPGQALFYDATNDYFRLPATVAEVKHIAGIVSYDGGTVQGTITPAATQNSDAQVQYGDGATVKIGVMGTFYVLAYAAMEYGARVRFRTSERTWESYGSGSNFGAQIDRTEHTFIDADVTDALTPPGTLDAPTNALNASAGDDDARDIWNDAMVALIGQVNQMQATLNVWQSTPCVCVSPSPVAAAGLAEVTIGWGRLF